MHTHMVQSKITYWSHLLFEQIPADNFSFTSASPTSSKEEILICSHAQWLEFYKHEFQLTRDIRWKTARKSFLPFSWNTTINENLSKFQRTIFEASRDYGVFSGICIPVHLKGKQFSVLGFSFKEASPSFEAQIIPIYNVAPLVSLYLNSYLHALLSNDEEAIFSLEKDMMNWLKANKKYERDLYQQDRDKLADSLFAFSEWLTKQNSAYVESDQAFCKFGKQQDFLLESFYKNRGKSLGI